MKVINGVEFSDSLGVLYGLKEKHNCKTLQETYKILENSDLDTAIEVLNVSYNKAHRDKPLTQDEFLDFLAEKGVGFIKIIEMFQVIVEALLFNGMSEQEITERKNALKNLRK